MTEIQVVPPEAEDAPLTAYHAMREAARVLHLAENSIGDDSARLLNVARAWIELGRAMS